jgi:dsRNA-specific ribonuclease
MDAEVGIIVVSPVFFGRKLEVDLYDLSPATAHTSSTETSNDLATSHKHNWHPITWAQEERLTEETLDLLSQINAHYFQVVLKTGEKSFNTASVGVFHRFSPDPDQLRTHVEAANQKKEFFYNYKNYYVLPVPPTHFRDVAKFSIDELVEVARREFREALELSVGFDNPFFEWKKYIFDVGGSPPMTGRPLGGKVDHSDPRQPSQKPGFDTPQVNDDIASSQLYSLAHESNGGNYLVLHPNITLGRLTLAGFIEIIAEFSWHVGQSESPTEFQKWFFTDKTLNLCRNMPLSEVLGSEGPLDQVGINLKECANFLAPLVLLLTHLRKDGPSIDAPDDWKAFIGTLATVHMVLVYRITSVKDTPDYNDRNRVSHSKESKLDFWEKLRAHRLLAGEMCLLPASWLSITAISPEGYNRYQRGLSMLINFERLAQIVELTTCLRLDYIPLQGLYIALQNSSADQDLNYEALETVGDSVLKFIVSLHLFTTLPGPEGDLTVRKNKIVQNETLGKAGMAVGVHLGIRLHKQKNQFVMPSAFSLDSDKLLMREREIKRRYTEDKSKKIGSFWAQKNELEIMTKFFLNQDASLDTVADVVEALIGAAFTQDYKLVSALTTIQRLGVLPDFDFQSFGDAFQKSVLIPEEFLKLHLEHKGSILERSSNRFLYEFGSRDRWVREDGGVGQTLSTGPDFLTLNLAWREVLANKRDTRELQLARLKAAREFQSKCIGYVFRNQYWFDQATDFSSNQFQRLEFLGDAVLEAYLIANLYHIFNRLDHRASPVFLTRAKAWLVSSHQLCRLAALTGLADCVITVGETGSNILKFLAKFNTNTRVEPEMASFEQKVASLEDAFEAMLGALFLDGSWEAVQAFLTPRLIGYLLYFANFHHKMGGDLKGDIQRHFDMDGKKLMYTYEKKGEIHTFKAFLTSDNSANEPKDQYETSSGPDKTEAEKVLMRKLKEKIIRTYKGGLGSS